MKKVLLLVVTALISISSRAQEVPKFYENFEKQKKQLNKQNFDKVFAQSSRKIKRAGKDSIALNSELALHQLAKAIAGDGMGVFFKETDSILAVGWQLLSNDTRLKDNQKNELSLDYSELYFNRGNYKEGLSFYSNTIADLSENATTVDSLTFYEKHLKTWQAYKAQGLFYKYNNELDTLLKYLPLQLEDSIYVEVNDSIKAFDKTNGKIKKRKQVLYVQMQYLKGATFFEQGYFKEGARFVEESLKTTKKLGGKTDVYPKMLKLKADLATVAGENKMARKTYKKAIKKYKKHYEKYDLPILELEEAIVNNYITSDREVAVIGSLQKLSKLTFKWGDNTNYYHFPHLRATINAHNYLKQYDKAEQLAIQLINYQSETLPYYHKTTRQNNGMTYQYLLSRNYFDFADTLSARQARSYETAFGVNTPKHGIALIKRAEYLTNYEFDLPTAKTYLFGENWSNYETSYSSWHPELIPARINRARILMYGNELEKATEELSKARKRNEDRFGSQNKTHATILLQWARLSLAKGEFEAAKDTTEIALALFEKIGGKKSLDYLLATQVLADYHLAKGNLYEAELLYSNVVANSKKIYNEIRLTEATDPESLAKLYLSIGDLDKAETMLNKSLTSKSTLFGENHISVLNANYLMADIHFQKGNLMHALHYGEAAVAIGESQLSDSRKIFLTTVKNTLAKTYIAIGDNESAKKQLSDVFDLQKEILGNKHIELGRTSLWLSEVDFVLGNLSDKECVKKLEQAAKAIKKSEDKDHPEYARALLIIAHYQLKEGDFLKAKANANEALGIVEAIKENNEDNLAACYYQLANIYAAENNFDVALDFNNKTAKIYSKSYHALHYHVLQNKADKVKLLYAQGKTKKAFAGQSSLLKDYVKVITTYINHFNRKERQIYNAQISNSFNDFYALALNMEAPEKYYAAVLENRWIEVQNELSKLPSLVQQVKQEKDSAVAEVFNNWLNIKQQEVMAVVVPKKDQKVIGLNVSNVKADVNDFEKTLRKKSAAFKAYIQSSTPSVKSVANQLNDSTTAIEMIRFNAFNSETDSASYAVLQLNAKEGKPQGIIIKNGKTLETEGLTYFHNASFLGTQDVKSFDTFWKSIHAQTKKYQNVYWAPDGVYHFINPEFLQISDSADVFSVTKLIRVQSLSGLNNQKQALLADSTAKLKLVLIPKQTSDSSAYAQVASDDIDWLKELESILAKNRSAIAIVNDSIITESDLLHDFEANIVQLNVINYGGKPLPKNNSIQVQPIRRKGILAGIVLSNGGELSKVKYPAYVNKNEGIMTTSEIRKMELSNTKLLVLPFFEMGYMNWTVIQNQEELIKAFKQAGAEAIVYTLKQVSQEHVKLFMKTFYATWQKTGDDVESIMYSTKQQLVKQAPEAKNDWNSFVLIR
jgi:hypothetical protein